MITHRVHQSKPINRIVSDNEITPENIKSALFFRSDYFRNCNPLENLILVRRYIVDVMFPECKYAYKLALTEILCTIITDELIRLRQFLEVPCENGHCSISRVFEAIVEDGKTGNAQLLGWSWLYYSYVQKELCITQQKFCELVSLDDRTIRRYQNVACERLAEILALKEWEIRRFEIWSSRAVLVNTFNECDRDIILKLYTILETIRTDVDLISAFAAFLQTTQKDGTLPSNKI